MSKPTPDDVQRSMRVLASSLLDAQGFDAQVLGGLKVVFRTLAESVTPGARDLGRGLLEGLFNEVLERLAEARDAALRELNTPRDASVGSPDPPVELSDADRRGGDA